jgi:lipopolysaccharide/colanic/teichoic acid biosynthesis glycosyltransferase
VISPALPFLPAPSPTRTVWGLDPVQLHSRYWASFGVQVVRVGEPSEVVRHAELYLLTDPRSLPLFRLSELIETLNWVEPTVLILRLRDTRERGYREKVVTDDHGRFMRFHRIYDATDERLARVALTPDREIAQLWQQAGDPLTGWRRLRRFVPREERTTAKIEGRVYDRTDDAEVARMLHEVVRDWRRPDATVGRARRVLSPAHQAEIGNGKTSVTARDQSLAWRDPTSTVDTAKLVGPVWVGAGRTLTGSDTIVGPAVVWDAPEARPEGEEVHEIEWLTIEPGEPPQDPHPRDPGAWGRNAKRIFDVCFALLGMIVTAPAWPVIMFLIWWEDGRPFFFGHTRQSQGGRPFKCWKFRSMYNNADEIKARLIAEGRNQADGAQFYMEDDPRITRIGRFLRKTNMDELPQFWNVLLGDMSMVGPRPSPDNENQFAPGWREARLSVQPGITGLWQIRRTRKAGTDFQEWIKYDIEYVERRTFWLDLLIIYRTAALVFRKLLRS